MLLVSIHVIAGLGMIEPRIVMATSAIIVMSLMGLMSQWIVKDYKPLADAAREAMKQQELGQVTQEKQKSPN